MPPPALRRLDAALVEGLGKAGQGRYAACLQALDGRQHELELLRHIGLPGLPGCLDAVLPAWIAELDALGRYASAYR